MIESLHNLEIKFDQLSDLTLPSNEEPFLLIVHKEHVKFEFLIRKKIGSDKAIVFGSGAYDATSDLQPPIFQRHKWIKHFDDTLIFYNDPTLYLGQINMGWGFGTTDSHYLKEIADILVILLPKLNIAQNSTLFYGSSAGGFMSLMLGGFIKGAHVLVNNPQTIVWNYYDRHVNAMFESAVQGLTREDIIEGFKDRLNVATFYKNIGYIPTITYLQNVASKRDLTHHLNPFIEELEAINVDIDDYLIVKLYADKALGHSPLKLDESLRQIKLAVDNLK